jgi:hypothetical protein
MAFSLFHRLLPGRRAVGCGGWTSHACPRPSPFCRRRTRRRLAVEQLEDRHLLSAIPVGAAPDDTAEYMLGDVSVTLVLMESDGSIDASTEDWTPADIAAVQGKVAEGLRWWEETLALEGSKDSLHFLLDETYADCPVPTGYEPISRAWDAYPLWVDDFLDYVGFNTSGDLSEDIRSFNQAQRLAHHTDWSFTIFVANSTHDPDDRFELGHELTGSFAFAGGLFFVTPSGRPASTIAHETGHIFYAKDEYPGGGSYFDCRGYYNTQNLNAWDGNPDPDSRVDSIMSSGAELANAYAHHLVSPSAKEMIGWKDSDGDGVFDVLDVPLMLEGSGAFDPHTETYRFLGESSVQTLPNRNTSGLGNDITLNEISRAQYRFDGGEWQTAAEYHTATAQLDLSIPVPVEARQIEIRTIDDELGVTSEAFRAAVGPAESTELPGINGFVWIDVDGDGLREVGEPGLKNWTVTLKQPDGSALGSPQVVEPDDFPEGTAIDPAGVAATLSVETVGGFPSSVGVAVSPVASTGDKVFAYQAGSTWDTLWTSDSRRLKIAFASPVSHLQIDAVADTDGDFGRLEVFDENDQLLARVTSSMLSAGQFETLEITRPTADIAYALVGGHMGSQVQLDNLRIGVNAAATTDSLGAFTFTGLDPGTYVVELGLRQGWTNVSPPTGQITVLVGAGEVKDGADFGVAPGYPLGATGSLWQNPANPLDVDDDGVIAPHDVLWIGYDLYYRASRKLPAPTVPPNAPAPYLDTNGDGYISPVDALLVARYLVSSSSVTTSGEQPAGSSVTSAAGNEKMEGGSLGGSGNVEGELSAANGSPSASLFALCLPAAPAEALAESPAKRGDPEALWTIRPGFAGPEAYWTSQPSSMRREEAGGTGLQAADRGTERGSEPSALDTAASHSSAWWTIAVLSETDGGTLTPFPGSAQTQDASLATDRLLSDSSWLEGFLSTGPSEAPFATPLSIRLDRADGTP